MVCAVFDGVANNVFAKGPLLRILGHHASLVLKRSFKEVCSVCRKSAIYVPASQFVPS